MIQLTETVGDIAAKNSRFADVFKKLGVDFSIASNKKTIKDACHEVGITEEQLKEVLQEASLIKPTTVQEFYAWNIDSLIDYIINTHHSFVKVNAIIIYDLAQQVAYKYNENHSKFAKLATKSFLFFHDILNNIMIEEEILFPNIKQLIKNRKLPGRATYTTFGLISESVKLMEKHHRTAEEDLKFLRKLTNNYRPSDDSCNYLFKKIQEFEKHWLAYVHLENNILFPKAIALDEALE